MDTGHGEKLESMRAVLGFLFGGFPQSDRVVFVSALKPCRAEEKRHTLVAGLPFSFFLSFIRFWGSGILHWRFRGLFSFSSFFFPPFKSIFRCRVVSCLRTSSLHTFLCLNHSKSASLLLSFTRCLNTGVRYFQVLAHIYPVLF